MLGNLRLSTARSLFLILTVLFFTVAANAQQQTNDSTAETENPKGESFLNETAPEASDKKKFARKETSFFEPPVVNKTAAAAEIGEERDTIPPDRTYKHRRGAIEYNFEFGVAPFKPARFAGPREYDIDARKMLTFDLRVGRTIGTKGPVTYAYMFGITPLVVAFKNEVVNPSYVSASITPGVEPVRRETSYGFGIAPANFRFTFLPNRRIKPFLKLGAGGLFFNKSMPVPRSGRYHFMGDWGGGLIIHPKDDPKRFFTIGARYLHISNANIRGRINNPGYNAVTLYFGFSIFR
jgi:Lipid A 3-O-deacylase (PagL)